MSLFRNRTLSVLALTAAMAITPLAANAANAEQGNPDTHQKTQQKVSWYGHGGHKAMRALNLTEEQQDQIFKIRQAQREAGYENKKALRSASQALQEQTKAGDFDSTKAKQAADKLGQVQAQMALLHAETQAKINAVLTTEQREQLTQMQSRSWSGKAGKHMRGHKMDMRGKRSPGS